MKRKVAKNAGVSFMTNSEWHHVFQYWNNVAPLNLFLGETYAFRNKDSVLPQRKSQKYASLGSCPVLQLIGGLNAIFSTINGQHKQA